MQAVLIRNPISGNPARQIALDMAIDEFVRAGWKLDIRQTQYKGHARDLAEAAVNEGYREIIVAGGDGSIGQVADGIIASGEDAVHFGIIPLGTGNVFARDVGLPFPSSSKDPATVRAARIIIEALPTPIDVGMANGHAFMCWAGCGIDAAITEKVENDLTFDKRRSPVLTYVRQLVRSLSRYDPQFMRITVDGQVTHEGYYYLAVASNIALYARYLRLTPRAYLNDGYLDLLILDAQQLVRFAYVAIKAATYPPARDSRIIRHRFRTLVVESESTLPYHLDGDPLGVAPFAVHVLEKKLHVYLNEHKAGKRLI